MTKVKIDFKNDLIKKINISGHSGYAESGKDIVCSAISGAVEVSLRFLDKGNVDYFCDIDSKNAIIQIEIKCPNDYTNSCLDSLCGFLNDLSIQYNKFLKII